MDELCSYVGIVSPTKNNLEKSRQKVKSSIHKTSEETLSLNRREHVLAARSSDNYPGDVTATIQGEKIKIARGPAATDGAGNTRAYNHLIRGSQHSLVVISLITQKPLVVISHQISCWRCSNAMTKLVKEKNEKLYALDISDVRHEGKCFRNTKHGPAVAEEYACVEAANALLFNKDGKFLGPEEACFIDKLVTDGDTRGAKKFIKKQCELLGDLVKGIATHIPDIGHFIKTISNGFYKFKTKNKEYSGVGLLVPIRIKTISSDVSRHLRNYRDNMIKPNSIRSFERKKCLDNIDSIIHHHCGNHDFCSLGWCKYKQIVYEEKAKLRFFKKGFEKKLSTELHKKIEERYSKVSRFQGRSMNISLIGQNEIKTIISSRITVDNIDKLAEIMSSNLCELYFGVLNKFSEGKRLNLDHADAWQIMQLFVAGILSDKEYTNRVSTDIGINKNTISNIKLSKMVSKKKYHSDYKRTEAAIFRRKLSKQGKNLLLGRNAKDKSRHIPDKLLIKSTPKKRKKKSTSETKCSNCGRPGHTKSDCMEVIKKPTKKKRKTADGVSVKEMEDCF